MQVDVPSVGFRIQGVRLDSQPRQQQGRHAARRAIGAVHHQAITGEIEPRRNQAHQVFNVSFHPAGNSLRGILLGVRQFRQSLEQALDLQFLGLRELGSGGRENLDAIVLVGIVRGGNHHAGGEFMLAGQEGHPRRGDDPGVNHLGAGARRGRSRGRGKSTRSIRACPFPTPPARGVEEFLRTVPKALPILRTVA